MTLKQWHDNGWLKPHATSRQEIGRTLQALPLILGPERKEDAEYLDRCRAKRNTVEYECVGGATQADAEELMEFVKTLKADVVAWLKKEHRDLAPQ